MKVSRLVVLAGGLWLGPHIGFGAIGDESLLAKPDAPGAFVLAHAGTVAPLAISANDWPGVRRAAGDLQSDLERVTNLKPLLGAAAQGDSVIIGTLGHSELIDGLV